MSAYDTNFESTECRVMFLFVHTKSECSIEGDCLLKNYVSTANSPKILDTLAVVKTISFLF